MSYVRIVVYSFECDHPGCTETLDVTPHPVSHPAREARRELADVYQWTHRDGADFCPDHSPLRSRGYSRGDLIREVALLSGEGVPGRVMAERLGLSWGGVSAALRRARRAGLVVPAVRP